MLSVLAVLALGQVQLPAQYQVPIDEALDHRNQWGISLSAGIDDVSDQRPVHGSYEPGVVPMLELGVSRAIGDLNEVQLRVRVHDDPYLRPAILLGYRRYTGEGPFTTFGELDAAAITGRDWGFGVHGQLGLQWDPARWGGLFLTGGALVAAGAALEIWLDLSLGAQVRF